MQCDRRAAQKVERAEEIVKFSPAEYSILVYDEEFGDIESMLADATEANLNTPQARSELADWKARY